MSNFSQIIRNYEKIKKEIPEKTLLLVVSKNQSVEAIFALYQAGCRDFGENKVQEWKDKKAQLPTDIRWHFIGNLQSNKIKYLLPDIFLIQSVSRLDLLQAIEKEAAKKQIKTRILIEFWIAQEESKQGFLYEEFLDFVQKNKLQTLFPHLIFCGVMGMASQTENIEKIAAEFQKLQNYFQHLQSFFDPNIFQICSMGMSADYLLALQKGSNCIRIGSEIFKK